MEWLMKDDANTVTNQLEEIEIDKESEKKSSQGRTINEVGVR